MLSTFQRKQRVKSNPGVYSLLAFNQILPLGYWEQCQNRRAILSQTSWNQRGKEREKERERKRERERDAERERENLCRTRKLHFSNIVKHSFFNKHFYGLGGSWCVCACVCVWIMFMSVYICAWMVCASALSFLDGKICAIQEPLISSSSSMVYFNQSNNWSLVIY